LPGVPAEILLVWLLFAVVAVEIIVTYSRLPARELYHVSGSGLEGGASRALVFVNFPLALVTIVIVSVFAEWLPDGSARAFAAIGLVLASAVFWPGVVSQANLDARPVNAIAAVGVLIAGALTVFSVHRLGRPRRLARRVGDPLRIAIAAVLVVVAIPWLAADLGLFVNGVPLLGRIFQSGEYLKRQSGLPPFPPAVHHGHHHGMDGLLLVLSALLLSRLLPTLRRGWLRGLLGAYLALMFCYGVGNIANDFWTEQVLKRGWTTRQIPNVLQPRATVAWGVIVVTAAVIWTLWLLRSRRDT
jgi:hypothetical protein